MDSLDEKPNRNKHVCGKGRRYTYNKLAYSQGRDHATFAKYIVNPNILSKKQHAKVLRDDENSQFAMNVPYSLNRKYRWEQISKADDLVSMDASVFPDKVKLDGCDAAYSINRATVIYGHCERNPDGSVQSTKNRGWALAPSHEYFYKLDTSKPSDDEKQKNPEVRYVTATVNPTECRYADKLFSRGDNCPAWRKGKLLPLSFDPDFWNDSDGDNEDEETEDTVDDMKAPSTFKLGDFITDKRRSKPNSSEASVESFEHVNAEDSDANVGITSRETSANETSLCKDTFFTEFEMDASQLGSSSTASFENLSQFNAPTNSTFRWLNSSKTSCAVDLSQTFHQAEANVVFVVVIEQLASEKFRILLNGTFPICSDFVLNQLKETSFLSIDAFLERCFTGFRVKYADTRLRTSRIVSDCQSTFHPAEFKVVDGVTPCTYPKFGDLKPSDDTSDSDLVKPLCEKCTTTEDTGYNVFDGCSHDFCRDCFRTELTDAILCQNTYPLKCLHPECMAPIRSEFLYVLLPLPITNFYFNELLRYEAFVSGRELIECPYCQSTATIQEKPKYNSVACWNCTMCFCLGCDDRPHFPLTCEQFGVWMEKFRLQHYLELSRAEPNSVCACQCGNILHHSNKTWKVTCRACGTQYNWKLREKFDDASIKLGKFADETTPNYIAAKYSDICLPTYEMRFDVKTIRDLKHHLKNMAINNHHAELLVSGYKLGLHLIEFGFAWLYLTKAQQLDEWSALKAQLTQLQITVSDITTAVRQGLSITDANQKAVELDRLNRSIVKLFLND
uniref:RING-type domain-containing protein n=1 Tax=Panagrellus redivivus TaxID=6233 RepID=A0A7E4VN27_PANRE